jgi:hypothetical protein
VQIRKRRIRSKGIRSRWRWRTKGLARGVLRGEKERAEV